MRSDASKGVKVVDLPPELGVGVRRCLVEFWTLRTYGTLYRVKG